jgi:hypothetical protein
MQNLKPNHVTRKTSQPSQSRNLRPYHPSTRSFFQKQSFARFNNDFFNDIGHRMQMIEGGGKPVKSYQLIFMDDGRQIFRISCMLLQEYGLLYGFPNLRLQHPFVAFTQF